jgi:hypothetical protein
MTVPQSMAEILQKHATLEVEGIDRMSLNVYVPWLQIIEGVLGLIRRHRGHPVVFTRMVEPSTRQFVVAIEKFVHDQGMPLVSFNKGSARRKSPPNSGRASRHPKAWSSLARPRKSVRSIAPRSVEIPAPEKPMPGS